MTRNEGRRAVPHVGVSSSMSTPISSALLLSPAPSRGLTSFSSCSFGSTSLEAAMVDCGGSIDVECRSMGASDCTLALGTSVNGALGDSLSAGGACKNGCRKECQLRRRAGTPRTLLLVRRWRRLDGERLICLLVWCRDNFLAFALTRCSGSTPGRV